MVARRKPEPNTLVVVFERDGQEPIRVEATNCEKALLRAIALLMARGKLHVGDRLRVEATD
jgi:hypothetical protein